MAFDTALQRLESYPYIPLGQYPTPLEYLPRLSRKFGRPIYMKRDDDLGPGMGGNKTRKLEYLMAAARRLGAGKVVTFGGLQSNHARLTAAAAARCGLEAHLFYFERRPSALLGNLRLNQLLGARMHFLPIGGGGGMSLESTIRLVRLVAWALVGRHYFIPVGGHSWLGCLGYVRAAREIDLQAAEQGLERPYIVLAAGTGGTLAALCAGLRVIHSPIQVLGLDVGRLWKGFSASIARLANEVEESLCGSRGGWTAQRIPLIEGAYAGPGYARPAKPAMEAICLVARQEGILLDPVYTGKAFAGMLDLLQKGYFEGNRPLIFLHTGGQPGLFAFEPDWIDERI